MSVKNQVLQDGQKDLYQNGLQIPLINLCMSDEEVYWLEPKKAECLLTAPNTTWVHAHIYFMYQVAKWEEKLRVLKQQRIEKHIGV